MANVGVFANIRTFLKESQKKTKKKKFLYIYEIHLVQTQEPTRDNGHLFMRNVHIPRG